MSEGQFSERQKVELNAPVLPLKGLCAPSADEPGVGSLCTRKESRSSVERAHSRTESQRNSRGVDCRRERSSGDPELWIQHAEAHGACIGAQAFMSTRG
jgi:hypothetical protein